MRIKGCGCLLVIIFLIIAFSMGGCADSKMIDGKTYRPYGLVNQNDVMDTSIVYTIPAGGVILGIIFCETIVVPCYVVGWDLYEPVRKR